MRTIRMIVAYDGTDFAGFQTQVDRRTVQRTLEQAIGQIVGQPTRVVGAGRTDAGVHASGQVISFQTESRLPPAVLRRALNAVLPVDVSALDAVEAPNGFDARFQARSREYRYTIWNAPERSALRHRYSYHWRTYLDVDAMDRAAQALVGRHDFAAYSGAIRPEARPATTVRSLFRLHCWRQGSEVFISTVANAFLPHMVRNLVGTLIPVGMRDLTTEDVVAILASRDRGRAGPTAPARGLCLTRVQYV